MHGYVYVDVTDIEAVQVGEYALLSGDDGTGAVSSYLLGQIIQGTAGEIAVGMSDRVQRYIV